MQPHHTWHLPHGQASALCASRGSGHPGHRHLCKASVCVCIDYATLGSQSTKPAQRPSEGLCKKKVRNRKSARPGPVPERHPRRGSGARRPARSPKCGWWAGNSRAFPNPRGVASQPPTGGSSCKASSSRASCWRSVTPPSRRGPGPVPTRAARASGTSSLRQSPLRGGGCGRPAPRSKLQPALARAARPSAPGELAAPPAPLPPPASPGASSASPASLLQVAQRGLVRPSGRRPPRTLSYRPGSNRPALPLAHEHVRRRPLPRDPKTPLPYRGPASARARGRGSRGSEQPGRDSLAPHSPSLAGYTREPVTPSLIPQRSAKTMKCTIPAMVFGASAAPDSSIPVE